MALSLGFPPVAVSNCLALCCPDFPLGLKPKRSSSNLTGVVYRVFTVAARFLCSPLFVQDVVYDGIRLFIKLTAHMCKTHLTKVLR